MNSRINIALAIMVFWLAGNLFPVEAARGEAVGKPTAAIKSLRPGEYIWRPELSPAGPVVVVVSLPEQLAHVYRNGVAIGVSSSSTGKAGKRTPTGVFSILQKRKRHFSSTYNNAPMPNMQRLTWRGIALHAGDLPGYPASMGCIRLPMEFSKHLFSVTHLGTPVIIADQKTRHSDLVNPGLILPAETTKLAEDKVAKTKGKKPPKTENTSSILVSGADRKAYVMTEGKIIYETLIRIKDPSRPLGNHLYSLLGPGPDGQSFRWMAFGFQANRGKASLWTAGMMRPWGGSRLSTRPAHSRWRARCERGQHWSLRTSLRALKHVQDRISRLLWKTLRPGEVGAHQQSVNGKRLSNGERAGTTRP